MSRRDRQGTKCVSGLGQNWRRLTCFPVERVPWTPIQLDRDRVELRLRYVRKIRPFRKVLPEQPVPSVS